MNEFRFGEDGYFEALAEHIDRQLKERAVCVVYDDEIERCWPRKDFGDTERREQIQAFAKFHWWSVSVHHFESGRVGAIFHPF
jgi:hypothetical protein